MKSSNGMQTVKLQVSEIRTNHLNQIKHLEVDNELSIRKLLEADIELSETAALKLQNQCLKRELKKLESGDDSARDVRDISHENCLKREVVSLENERKRVQTILDKYGAHTRVNCRLTNDGFKHIEHRFTFYDLRNPLESDPKTFEIKKIDNKAVNYNTIVDDVYGEVAKRLNTYSDAISIGCLVYVPFKAGMNEAHTRHNQMNDQWYKPDIHLMVQKRGHELSAVTCQEVLLGPTLPLYVGLEKQELTAEEVLNRERRNVDKMRRRRKENSAVSDISRAESKAANPAQARPQP